MAEQISAGEPDLDALFEQTAAQFGGLDGGEVGGGSQVGQAGQGGAAAAPQSGQSPQPGARRASSTHAPPPGGGTPTPASAAAAAPPIPHSQVGGQLPTAGHGAAGYGAAGQAAAAGPSLRAALAATGWDVSGFTTDEEADQHVQYLVEQAQAAEELRGRVQQFEAYLPEFREFLATKQGASGNVAGGAAAPVAVPAGSHSTAVAPAAQPVPASPARSEPSPLDWPTKPEMKSEWMKWVEQDASGRWVLKDTAPIRAQVDRVDEKVNAYAQWRQSLTDRLGDLPTIVEQIVERVVGPKLSGLDGYVRAEKFGEMLQQHVQQTADDRAFNEFVSQHANRFFEVDAAGKVRTDPVTNAPIPNELGRLVKQHADSLKAMGATDVAKIRRYALATAIQEMQAKQPAGAAALEAPAAAAGSGATGGTAPAAAGSTHAKPPNALAVGGKPMPEARPRDSQGRFLSQEEVDRQNAQHKESFLSRVAKDNSKPVRTVSDITPETPRFNGRRRITDEELLEASYQQTISEHPELAL